MYMDLGDAQSMHVQEGAAMKSNLEKVQAVARDLRDDKDHLASRLKPWRDIP